jgi:4-hydroxybenzoate polyprenyltransferase
MASTPGTARMSPHTGRVRPMPTSVIRASITRAAATRYFSCLRLADILALQGSPLIGAVFARRHAVAAPPGPLAILIVANVCLVAHIFTLNDWSNIGVDLTDPNKAADVFSARGVGHKEMAALTAGLLLVSLGLVSRLGAPALWIASAISALSALYSLPPFALKARPMLSSAAHVVGGALHFLLGYSLGGVIDRRGMTAALFFAVTFASGHLTQEVRDHDGDVRSGIRTNAAVFGKRRTFAASLALFALSQALLVVVILDGALPHALAVMVFLYFFHLWWSLRALHQGLTYTALCRLQARYRVLYALIGVVLGVALWLQ